MVDITGSITKIRTSDNSEHYINAKYWDGHEWGELASALKYCGITTTKLTDGATTNPVVIDGANHNATAGCVVFYEDTEGGKSTTKEFVFNGSKWELLGGDSTYKVIQSSVSSPNADGSAMAFIDTISQDANGVITVTKKYCKKQYRLEYTATESLGHLSPCNINSVLHEYDTSTGKGVFVYDDEPISIGDEAFYECTSLTSVIIPDSVTSIGETAFAGCTSLTSVTIPDSVTSIGGGAFLECTSLKSITIPDSVTSIGEGVFLICSGLKSITIPDSVTSIGDFAFNGCSGLKSVTIPDSVTSIGDYAFAVCTSLTSVTIGNSVTSIGINAFNGCNNLTSVYCKSTTPPSADYEIFGTNESIKKIYVPINSLDAYKSATNWSQYADIMVGSEILSLSDDSLMSISISLEARIKYLENIIEQIVIAK